MRSRIYVTVNRPSVCPSVCPVDRQQQRDAAGLLLSVQLAGDIDRQQARAIFAILHRRPPTRSAFDNSERHVTAFRPISEAAIRYKYNTKFVKRHVAVASEALANRTVKKQ